MRQATRAQRSSIWIKSAFAIYRPHAVLLLVGHSPFANEPMGRGAMVDVQLGMECKMCQSRFWSAVESGQSIGNFHCFIDHPHVFAI
jgi:hypothetical protein